MELRSWVEVHHGWRPFRAAQAGVAQDIKSTGERALRQAFSEETEQSARSEPRHDLAKPQASSEATRTLEASGSL